MVAPLKDLVFGILMTRTRLRLHGNPGCRERDRLPQPEPPPSRNTARHHVLAPQLPDGMGFHQTRTS